MSRAWPRGGVSERQAQTVSDLLAREYAAVFALAAGGGRLASPNQAGALGLTRAAFDAHRVRRDALIAGLQSAAAPVPVAAPSYQVRPGAGGTDTLRFLADIADVSVAAYRDALARLTDPALRKLAVAAVAQDARYRAAMHWAAGDPDATASIALPG